MLCGAAWCCVVLRGAAWCCVVLRVMHYWCYEGHTKTGVFQHLISIHKKFYTPTKFGVDICKKHKYSTSRKEMERERKKREIKYLNERYKTRHTCLSNMSLHITEKLLSFLTLLLLRFGNFHSTPFLGTRFGRWRRAWWRRSRHVGVWEQ